MLTAASPFGEARAVRGVLSPITRWAPPPRLRERKRASSVVGPASQLNRHHTRVGALRTASADHPSTPRPGASSDSVAAPSHTLRALRTLHDATRTHGARLHDCGRPNQTRPATSGSRS